MRRPAVAGMWYEAAEAPLRRQMEECFTHQLGPGRVPAAPSDRPRRLVGLVVPHAGLMYSGPVAAHAYAALAEDGLPETFVILGPNHYGLGSFLATDDRPWDTPLGAVQPDAKIMRALTRGPIDLDAEAHRREHSIEAQLPFLQYLRRENRFAPVCMALQDLDVATEVGEAVAQAIEGRDAVIIASTDFTHVGPHYGQLPPRGETAPAFAKRQDRKALDRIEAMDPKGLQQLVAKERLTMCGYGPVTAMLVAAKALGAKQARVLKYATSSDVSGDEDTAVGYAAAVVTR